MACCPALSPRPSPTAGGGGRGEPGQDRAEDPRYRGRGPRRPEGFCLVALVPGVLVEELVDIGVVHAGEAAGRQRGQDVRVRPGRGPGLTFPSLGQRDRRAAAAPAVPPARTPPPRRPPATEPAGTLERPAPRHGAAPAVPRLRPGHARV